jgi:hypothetical protein
VYAIEASNKNHDSKAFCSSTDQNLCSASGKTLRSAALTDGNIATAAFVAGGVLAATGVTMIVLGHRREEAGASPSSAWIEATPMIDARFIGGSIRGGF